MNFASRFYWQLAAVVLVATVLLGLISANKRFEEKVDAYSRTAVAALSARPELTFLLYARDSSALESFQKIALRATGSESSV
ncbi:MAG: hypothetical protein KDI09_04385, partial [Halioglobus sp.]|nr:hypothetical protein [Halioglobus sp.]